MVRNHQGEIQRRRFGERPENAVNGTSNVQISSRACDRHVCRAPPYVLARTDAFRILRFLPDIDCRGNHYEGCDTLNRRITIQKGSDIDGY